MKGPSSPFETSTLNRRTLLKGIGAGMLTMIVGESLSACTAAPAGLENLPILVINPPAGGTHLPLLIKAKEFDKKAGVNVVLEARGDATAYYNDLIAGQVPVNHGGAANIFGSMRNKGVPVTITMSSCILGQLIVVPQDSPIKKTADLKGKRLTLDRAGYVFAWLLRLCKDIGMNLEQDVTLVNASLLTVGSILAKGDADAAQMPTGTWEALDAANPGKFKILYDVGDELAKLLGVKTIYTLVGARDEFVSKNPKLMEKMFTIWREATDWVNKNMPEAIDILSKPADQGGTGLPKAALENQMVKFKTLRFEVVPAIRIKDDLGKEFKAYQEVGFLDKIPDAGIIWDGLKQYA